MGAGPAAPEDPPDEPPDLLRPARRRPRRLRPEGARRRARRARRLSGRMAPRARRLLPRLAHRLGLDPRRRAGSPRHLSRPPPLARGLGARHQTASRGRDGDAPGSRPLLASRPPRPAGHSTRGPTPPGSPTTRSSSTGSPG